MTHETNANINVVVNILKSNEYYIITEAQTTDMKFVKLRKTEDCHIDIISDINNNIIYSNFVFDLVSDINKDTINEQKILFIKIIYFELKRSIKEIGKIKVKPDEKIFSAYVNRMFEKLPMDKDKDCRFDGICITTMKSSILRSNLITLSLIGSVTDCWPKISIFWNDKTKQKTAI